MGDEFGSDYLSTHLHFASRVAETACGLAWSKADWGKFAAFLDRVGLIFDSLNSKGEIERATKNYTRVLHNATEKVVPKIQSNGRRKA